VSGWTRWFKDGRRWRREVSCPRCGRIMTAECGNKRYACGNKSCAVIEVRFKRDGAAEVLVDSVKSGKTRGGRPPRGLSLSIRQQGEEAGWTP
jgi:ribosomal protein S27AE